MRSAWFELARRDLLLAWRKRAEASNPLLFFLIVASLFPLGIGPGPAELARIAPAVVWVTALLASLLSTDSLFRADFDDGSLEQIVRSPSSLYALVLAKMAVHWLITGLPLTLSAPLVGGLLYLPVEAMPALLLALLLGTISLSLIGGIGAALTVGLRKGGVLVSLLILPLYVPVLVFGTAAVNAAAGGSSFLGPLAVLGAFALLALTLAPLAVAAAVRIALDQ